MTLHVHVEVEAAMRRRMLSAILVVLAAATAVVLGPATPASAACGYHDYGTAFAKQENGSHYYDAAIWISLRRTTDCHYYVVVKNVRATGRDTCYWALAGLPTGQVVRGDCPSAGNTVSSGAYGASSSAVYGYLQVEYLSGRPCPAGIYSVFINTNTSSGLGTPQCGIP